MGSDAEKMIVHRRKVKSGTAAFATTLTVLGVVPVRALAVIQLQEVVGATGTTVAVQAVGPGPPSATDCDPVLPHARLKLSVPGLTEKPEHSAA